MFRVMTPGQTDGRTDRIPIAVAAGTADVRKHAFITVITTTVFLYIYK